MACSRADEAHEAAIHVLPRIGLAFVGAVVPVAMLVLASASLWRGSGAGTQPGLRSALLLLGVMTVIVPALIFFGIRSRYRMCLTRDELRIGRSRIRWVDVERATWRAMRGRNDLLLHRAAGSPVRLSPSAYPGGETAVVALLRTYLPAAVLAEPERRLLESE